MATPTEWIVKELPGLSEKDREDIIDLIERQHFDRKASGCRDVETGGHAGDPKTHIMQAVYPGFRQDEEEGEGEVGVVDAPKAEPYRFRYICVFVVISGGINVYCPSIGSMSTIGGDLSDAERHVADQFPESAQFAILYHGGGGFSANFHGSDTVKKMRYMSVESFLRSLDRLIGPDKRISECRDSLDTIASGEWEEYPAVSLYNNLYRMGLDSDQLRILATLL